MKLLWTDRAERDLNEIFDHIAEDSPDRAYRWVSRLRQRARSAAGMPFAGRKVPERESLREVIEGNYRIVYQTLQDGIVVLTVFEGHRLFPLPSLDELIKLEDPERKAHAKKSKN